MEIKYANTLEEALLYRDLGYEPVECSYEKTSVVGKLILDHHGKYSNEPAVSVKAALLSLNNILVDKFVVTGTADCDQCYAIAALNNKIPVNLDEAIAIAEIDTDPVGRDLTHPRYQKILLFNTKVSKLTTCLNSTIHATNILIDIYNNNFSDDELKFALDNYQLEYKKAKESIILSFPNIVALVSYQGPIYDAWSNIAPIIVNFTPYKKNIRLTVTNKSIDGNKSGIDILGKEGLNLIYPILNEKIKPGWGGRELVGASPRNEIFDINTAKKVYFILIDYLRASSNSEIKLPME